MAPTNPKIPKAGDFALIKTFLIQCLLEINKKLKDSKVLWAIGGDLAESLNGVIVNADCVEILTSEEDVHEIYQLMKEYDPTEVSLIEERLPRDAEVGGEKHPVYVKSQYCELAINKIKVKIYGGLQYKVDNWEWGDTLEFQPDYVYVVGEKMAVIPLRLKSELFISFGWIDRVEKISAANTKKLEHHHYDLR